MSLQLWWMMEEQSQLWAKKNNTGRKLKKQFPPRYNSAWANCCHRHLLVIQKWRTAFDERGKIDSLNLMFYRCFYLFDDPHCPLPSGRFRRILFCDRRVLRWFPSPLGVLVTESSQRISQPKRRNPNVVWGGIFQFNVNWSGWAIKFNLVWMGSFHHCPCVFCQSGEGEDGKVSGAFGWNKNRMWFPIFDCALFSWSLSMAFVMSMTRWQG